jgi:cytochrome c
VPRPEIAALLIVVTSVSALPSVAMAAEPGDPVRGERVFQRCYACHSDEPDEGNLQGPNLYKVLGRPAAVVPGFEYSQAMKQKAAAGLVWDAATLDAFIADPDAVVPGTLMSIPPVRNAQERSDLIAYLARFGRFQD